MILDTNAVSALMAGDEDLADVLSGSARHHLPVIVLGEYRYGLKESRHRKSLESLLDKLEKESFVLPADGETARIYAEVRHAIKTKGKPIPENDVWIAALARQHGLPVVTRDGHFSAVPGLERVSW